MLNQDAGVHDAGVVLMKDNGMFLKIGMTYEIEEVDDINEATRFTDPLVANDMQLGVVRNLLNEKDTNCILRKVMRKTEYFLAD